MQGDLIGGYGVGRGGGGQRSRQCGQCRLSEQFTDGKCIPRPAQAFNQFNRQQGMTTELEEMILTPDTFNPQQLLPYRGNRLFGCGLRCLEVGAGKGVVIRGG